MSTPTDPQAASEAESLAAPHAAEPSPVAEVAAAAAPAEPAAQTEEGADDGDDGDDDAAGPDGPAGPAGPDGEAPKKKKRRRRKKKPGAAAGPEGPAGPVGPEVPAGGDPAAPREKKPQKERSEAPRKEPAFRVGEQVFGHVTSVMENAIIVDIAGKALGIFDRNELAGDDALPAPGDKFVAEVLGDGVRGGLIVLTRKPLREEEARNQVEQAFKDQATVLGLVTGLVKGGIEVYCDGLRAFAPASHVDLRLGADLTHLIGQRLPFVVETFAKRGRDLVLSRRSILEDDHKKQRAESLAKLVVGSTMKGVVRTVVDFGFFVAIPEADDVEGLVHLTEMSHDFHKRPADVAKVGDEVEVKILKIDERGKLWLSKKATEPDPWEGLRTRFAPGTRHTGKVVRIEPFGAFVQLEEGQDGLIHIADLSLKRIDRCEDVVKLGQELEVVVAEVDLAKKRIGLHPAPPADEAGIHQKVAPHKSVKVKVVLHETGGLLVRIVGMSGRKARGFIPAGQTGTPRGTDLRKLFPVGSEHEVKVVEIDPRRGDAKLSIKGLKEDTEKAAYNDYKKAVAKEAKFGTFADLLKKS